MESMNGDIVLKHYYMPSQNRQKCFSVRNTNVSPSHQYMNKKGTALFVVKSLRHKHKSIAGSKSIAHRKQLYVTKIQFLLNLTNAGLNIIRIGPRGAVGTY